MISRNGGKVRLVNHITKVCSRRLLGAAIATQSSALSFENINFLRNG